MKIPRIACLAAMLTLPSVVSASNRGKDPLDHDCTGWMIFSDLNGNGTSILHKDCDAHPRHVTVLQSSVTKTKFQVRIFRKTLFCLAFSGKYGILYALKYQSDQ